ncbi:MAG: LysR family transcriptional regulator [Clostridiales bacterium]
MDTQKWKEAYTLDARIRLRKEGRVVYGSGIARLLALTDQLKSLHGAAGQMGMPYRKALSIVRRAEEELGRPLLERSIGGAGGGGSRLTPFGLWLSGNFQAFEAEVNQYVEQLKDKYFNEGD